MSLSILDPGQVLKDAHSAANNSLRVSLTDTSLAINHAQDSIKVGDGTDLLAVNSDGSINVVTTTDNPDEEIVSEFSSISSVISGSNTTLLTYTVPLVKTGYLQRIEIGGNNIGTYEIYFNSVLSGRKRTYFGGSLSDVFNFEGGIKRGFKLLAGTIVQLKVLHNRPYLGDFEARLQVILTN